MTDRLRFAAIGAGWWAHTAHLPALAADPTIDFVAVCDPDARRAAGAARDFGASRSFTDVAELLAVLDIDCAVVATPHTTHRPIVEQLLRAGVHVVVEKPMTTTAEDAWFLVELARERGLILSVGLTYQYAATAFQVRDVIREQIGDLVAVNAEFSSGTQDLFGTVDVASANLDDAGMPHGTTYSNPALSGGGQGQTQLTHLLGNLMFNTGRQAIEAFAFMDNRGLPVDLVNALTFRLDGGTLGVASSTGTTPAGAQVRHLIRYHGTTAMVEHDLLSAEAWVYELGGGIRHIHNPDNEPSYRRTEPVPTLARVVRGEAENPAPADLAAAAVSLTDAAYVSASEHRPVDVTRGTIYSGQR